MKDFLSLIALAALSFWVTFPLLAACLDIIGWFCGAGSITGIPWASDGGFRKMLVIVWPATWIMILAIFSI